MMKAIERSKQICRDEDGRKPSAVHCISSGINSALWRSHPDFVNDENASTASIARRRSRVQIPRLPHSISILSPILALSLEPRSLQKAIQNLLMLFTTHHQRTLSAHLESQLRMHRYKTHGVHIVSLRYIN